MRGAVEVIAENLPPNGIVQQRQTAIPFRQARAREALIRLAWGTLPGSACMGAVDRLVAWKEAGDAGSAEDVVLDYRVGG